jgi:hypothetical protein
MHPSTASAYHKKFNIPLILIRFLKRKSSGMGPVGKMS